MDELAGVGAYVEHEVDGKLGEEELVAELLRGVDTGLPDLEAGGFGEGAQGVFEMGIHSPQFSVLSCQFSGLGDRRWLCANEACAAKRMESMVMSQRGKERSKFWVSVRPRIRAKRRRLEARVLRWEGSARRI